MKNNKFYAYLTPEEGMNLAKGNLDKVGQVFDGDTKLVERTIVLEKGERYVQMMKFDEFCEFLNPLRQECRNRGVSGGVICEFDIPESVRKTAQQGHITFLGLREGFYRPWAEVVMVESGDKLKGCYNGRFVSDIDQVLTPKKIQALFAEQENLESTIQPNA